MRIYISGAITDHLSDAKERFLKAEDEIIEKYGHHVEIINPYEVGQAVSRFAVPKHSDYMRVSLTLMDLCDAIYFIDGWKESKGCNMEKKYAENIGLKVLKE